MTHENQNNVTEFTIQSFTDTLELQLPLFVIFLLIYIVIICGNCTIFFLILKDPNLHTPMYIFLMMLSFTDISSSSNIMPILLHMLRTQCKTISFMGCVAQMYVFLSLTSADVFLLGAMAYDRYVAICHPLRYFSLMSLRRCGMLIIMSWIIGFTDPLAHAYYISRLTYCASHRIDHFFCDVPPLLKLSCSDTSIIEMLTYVEGALLTGPDFLLILISYVFIIFNIMNIKSLEGRLKAFSTCTSHLTCVIVFFGAIMCMYMRPTSSLSPKLDKFFALLYVVLVPLLNPVIYSLKNQEVKTAFRKLKKDMLC